MLDAKITSVLLTCHDQAILGAVQAIIQNMIACEDTSQQQLHYLQSCGFGGLWRFAGPFTKVNDTEIFADSVILFKPVIVNSSAFMEVDFPYCLIKIFLTIMWILFKVSVKNCEYEEVEEFNRCHSYFSFMK